MIVRYFPILFLSLILSSCIPSHCRQEAKEMPQEALEKAADKTFDEYSVEPMPCQWWEFFHDAQLNNLVEQALCQNPTFQTSQKRILGAIAKAMETRSILYPSLNWQADVQRIKLSKTGVFPPSVTIPGTGISPAPVIPGLIPFSFTQYETFFSFSFDLDLWGKNRNTYAARLNEIQARAADASFAKLILSAGVVEAYLQLQIDYERKQLAKELYQNRQDYAHLTSQRIENNLESQIFGNTIDLQISQTKGNLIDIESLEHMHTIALQALVSGDFQETIAPLHISKNPLPKLPYPCNLPLHLLARRPDIQASLWTVEASNHLVQVAKAGFYPDVNLLGFFGFQTLDFSKFFQWASSYGDAEAAVTLPIFDAGRIRSHLQDAYIDQDIAILHYNELVVQAVKEVLEALTLLATNKEKLSQYQNEAGLQEEIYRLTYLKAQNHLESELNALDAKKNALVAADLALVAYGNVLQQIVQLIKALGGDYESSSESNEAPQC